MRKIILIPGNPGLIKMYDSFLDILHKLQNREIEILGVSHANHFISKKCNRVYNLEEQIHQKIKFM
jgi:ABC-type Mn2+/Zn2+ transport system ATPase subunit